MLSSVCSVSLIHIVVSYSTVAVYTGVVLVFDLKLDLYADIYCFILFNVFIKNAVIYNICYM